MNDDVSIHSSFCTANSNYELGRGDKIGGWKPNPVPSLEDARIIQVACGGYHSLALTGIIIIILVIIMCIL